MNKKAYVKGYGEVWFYEQAITNILALKMSSASSESHMIA